MATKMTDKLFRAVKIMIAGGATSTEISEYFNISLSSISRVRQAETFQEYRVMQAATYGKRKPAKTQDAPKQSEVVIPVAVITTGELISRKMAFIVDQLS